MGWIDLMTAIEGYNDGEMIEANRFRHLMLAPHWAMGGKETVSKVFPLPIDKNPDYRPMSENDFIALANRMAELDKRRRAKA